MSSVEDESNMQLIKVEIYDKHASSSIQKAFPTTQTSALCEAIASKVDVKPDQTKYFNLILVISWVNEANAKKFSYIRTLKSNEAVLTAHQSTLKKIHDKMSLVSSHSPIARKKKPSVDATTSASMSSNNNNISNLTSRWFYKDMRTIPLDYNNKDDISANSSSSEDEEEISADDFSYVNQFERRGYLLRRSRKDPNLWRKRYCILVDNLWCIDYIDPNSSANSLSLSSTATMRKRSRPKAMCIKIGRHFRVFDRVQGFEYPFCIALQLQSKSTSQNIVFLRASSEEEQRIWINEINKRLTINTENQTISMAEIMMSDEISLQSDKLAKDFSPSLDRIYHTSRNNSTVANLCSSPTAASRVRGLTWGSDKLQESVEDINESDVILQEDLVINSSLSTDGGSIEYPAVATILEDVQIPTYQDSISMAASAAATDFPSISVDLDAYDREVQCESTSNISSPINVFSPAIAKNSAQIQVVNTISSSSPRADGVLLNSGHLYFSLRTQTTLNLRIHRSPRYSLLHELHQKTPLISQMFMFIADVNRYKQLHRTEVFPNVRNLWIHIVIIFQKYLLYQLSLLTSKSADQYSSNKGTQPQTPPPLNPTSSTSSRLINSSKSRYFSTKLSSAAMHHHTIDWEISSDILLNIHRKVFSNIRRQIAGFDLLTSLKLPSLNNLVNDDNSSSNNASDGSEAKPADLAVIPNMKKSTPTSSNQPTPSSGLSWFWGSSNASNVDTKDKQINEEEEYNARHNISYNDIYGKYPGHSTLASSTSSLASPSMTTSMPPKNNNQPIYQIINLEEIPSKEIFDDVVLHVLQKIQNSVL